MVVEEDRRSMEEGLIQQRHQNDIDDPRVTTCVILSTFVAVCSSFSFGCAGGYTSGAESQIMKELDLSIAEFSAFGSFLNLGAALGAFCSGQLAITLGRRRDVLWLDAGRISLGIGVGLISYVVPVYIAEITPKHVRGAFTSSNQLFQNCGLSVIYFFGTVINWRLLAIIGALPCIIQAIGIYFIPESPRWLAKIGTGKEVEHSLQQLRGRDADVSGESAEIQVMTKRLEEDSKSSFYDMFQKKYRRTLVIGIGLMLIQQLSGAAGVTYYSNTIFRKAGFSETVGSMIFGVFVIPKALLAVIFVDKWGRRPLLLVSAAGMSIGSLLIGVCFTLQGMDILPELTAVVIFICILVYFGCFAIGVGGLPWVIMSEIFPINIKVSAGTIVALTSWTTGWFVSYAFNFMFEWSAQGTFYIFGVVGGASLVFIWFLVPETKGQSLEELQASLTGTT
ncbi:sugar transporter ERD6-like 11 isoform X2 [Brassica napus]|uniref:sugar transporter ERD6-like 11 isoform X2 n=1 Tax=Brassica napus TaxID=3708 RepID=UPI0020789D47|nr:sugar transporter ERD6-like 11 isoform X2 [Brassica napus]